MVPREYKNNAYAKFGGTNKEYYGIFRSGLFKILIYANYMTCDVTGWTQSGVKSQKIEYLSQLFLYRTET